jgi:hypothetical protein
MEILVHCAKKKGHFTIGSKIIMAADGTDFSHVALELLGFGGSLVMESVYPESRIITGSRWREDYEIVRSFRFEFKEKFSNELFVWCIDKCGIPYSVGSLFRIWLSILARAFSLDFKDSKTDGYKTLICTELVGGFLESFKGVEFKNPNDRLTLSDIFCALLELETREGVKNDFSLA